MADNNPLRVGATVYFEATDVKTKDKYCRAGVIVSYSPKTDKLSLVRPEEKDSAEAKPVYKPRQDVRLTAVEVWTEILEHLGKRLEEQKEQLAKNEARYAVCYDAYKKAGGT